MNREIKFRVKDINDNWHYYTLGDFVCHTPIPAQLNPETWTQYTGLKDAEGVEIYEGDVIEWFGNNWIIEWEDSDASFFAVEIVDRVMHESGQEWGGDCKVVGNIYQNREVLDEGNHRY